MKLNVELIDAAAKMHLKLSDDQAEKCIVFLQLIKKWSKAYNLTAITDIQKMLTYHLLDSLSITSYLRGDKIVDVGCGAGLPGIPLAIFNQEKQFTLIDSVGKKIRFINQAVRELGLKNVTTVHCRGEAFEREKFFTTMTARAVGSMGYLLPIAEHLLQPGGLLLAMKSDLSKEAIAEVPSSANRVVLQVPGITEERCAYLCYV